LLRAFDKSLLGRKGANDLASGTMRDPLSRKPQGSTRREEIGQFVAINWSSALDIAFIARILLSICSFFASARVRKSPQQGISEGQRRRQISGSSSISGAGDQEAPGVLAAHQCLSGIPAVCFRSRRPDFIEE
jgi:hypothetical protein